MLLDCLKRDEKSFPHIISAVQHPHKILINTSDSLLIFCQISQVYIAEYSGENIDEFLKVIRQYEIKRLQTTNQLLYQKLIPFFLVHYECVQAVYNVEKESENFSSCFKTLEEKDLTFAAESYGLETYINQLYQRGRLFGWYEAEKLIGYVAFHIDESVGALYIKPEFRKLGYGAKLMKFAFEKYESGIPYSQIVNDNFSSIKLHEKIGCTISDKPLYWVYDEDYQY